MSSEQMSLEDIFIELTTEEEMATVEADDDDVASDEEPA
jgi:hypothetical protein